MQYQPNKTMIPPTAVVRGEHVRIGENTIIADGAVIYDDVVIGDNCYIAPGAVVGAFGFDWEGDFPAQRLTIQSGGVTIGDNCYIGPGSIIERGTHDNTIIGDSVKIDAQCVVGGESFVGDGCKLFAGSVLDRSSIVGEYCQTGSFSLVGGVKLGAWCIVAPGTIVTTDSDERLLLQGVPAVPIARLGGDYEEGDTTEGGTGPDSSEGADLSDTGNQLNTDTAMDVEAQGRRSVVERLWSWCRQVSDRIRYRGGNGKQL